MSRKPPREEILKHSMVKGSNSIQKKFGPILRKFVFGLWLSGPDSWSTVAWLLVKAFQGLAGASLGLALACLGLAKASLGLATAY